MPNTSNTTPPAETTVPLRAAVAALPAYVPGARPDGQAWKLSSNENPFPPAAAVVSAITEAAREVNRYPDMYATELVTALAEHNGVAADQVVVGNGSVAVLQHVLEAVVEPGDEVVFPWRSFEAYPIVVAVAGGAAVTVPVRDDGRLDLPAMAAAVTPRTRAVLVCTPNNPTGPVVRSGELETFLADVPKDVLVVIDEAYLEFVRDPEVPDALDVLRRYPNAVVVRTLSKASGLAGLRVGYAVAAPRLAAGIRSTSTPFGVNHLAQRAAVATLQPAVQAELLEHVDALVAERTRVVDALREQGWQVPDTHANFVWLATGDRTAELAAQAAAAGVLVRPFGAEGMRVSIGEVAANDAFLGLAADWR
ncbi:histidinol-phosphate transaminase [Isoptericola aurantiacus]|uniref:histidinol-phosphate transaminase n=1 Tax=Isoptericola aurantiacus TaxID=3377839 RepID=UPI00383AF515